MQTLLRGPTLAFALVFLAIATLTRAVLLFKTGLDHGAGQVFGPIPPSLWPGLFLHGFGFDLVVLAWFCAPLLLLTALRRKGTQLTPWRKASRLLMFWLASSFLLFSALSEWTFWDEFSTRGNFIAVDYLIYTQEVIGNIKESYPVTALVSLIAALGAGVTWVLRRQILTPVSAPASWRARVAYAVLAIALPWSTLHIADLDQMEFSGNAYANELAGNGFYTFASAARRNELDYDRFYRTIPDADAQRILADLGSPRAQKAAGISTLAGVSNNKHDLFARPPKNVVLISVESLSAKYMGAYGNSNGNADNLTPQMDKLANEGQFFTRLYATGTRTVRGLEALSLGTPPIPGQAIVRRPGNEHLSTIGEVLKKQGYSTFFIYGGYGYFDNMNGYFGANNYTNVDRTDFPNESIGFENVWGVSDEFLFDNALTQIDKTHAAGKPFLTHIMTTSNHRPYTFPDGRIDIPQGSRRGAVKYTDYAIGRFVEQASKKPWFADTLFVIVADHCASVAGNTKLPVPGYHIPLILYAPKLLKPGRNAQLASQIDIPPTLLDVMELKGKDQFYGSSLFENTPKAHRTFISNYQELGYLKDDTLIVLGPKQKVETFLIDAQGNSTPTALNKQLADEATAWYQTAARDFKEGKLKLPAEF